MSTPVSPALRIVHLSDTHDYLSHDGSGASLPDGDVLLHTGDFSNHGTAEEFELFNAFLGAVAHRYPTRIVIMGNHDVRTYRDDWPTMVGRLSNATAVPVFETVDVAFPCGSDGSRVAPLRVFGAPWHYFHDWTYAPRAPGVPRFEEIPHGVDVVMTHGPASRVGRVGLREGEPQR